MNDATLAEILFTLRVIAVAIAFAWACRRLPSLKLRLPGRRHPVTWAERSCVRRRRTGARRGDRVDSGHAKRTRHKSALTHLPQVDYPTLTYPLILPDSARSGGPQLPKASRKHGKNDDTPSFGQAYGTEGCRFESYWVYCSKSLVPEAFPAFLSPTG
jgi:hypothetical protein